jgi:hypothetical protein
MAGSGSGPDIRKLVREFAMLVVGVMVALSADSCWQDHQAGSEIAALLDVLESELGENREELTVLLERRTELVRQNGALVASSDQWYTLSI